MTVAEIQRYIEGATWRLRNQAQFDYVLANLIGISSARMMSSEVKMPEIEEAYPNLFAAEGAEEKPQRKVEEDKMTESKNRFLAFAMAHNAKLRREEVKLKDDN